MVKRVFGLILFAASCVWAQNPAPPVTGQITAATTNATCANNGVQNGGAVDQPINSFTGAVGISVTGTWTATLNIQTTVDHGKTWTASGGTFTANQQSVISSVGNTDVCVFASAFTSGTAIVTFATSAVPPAGVTGTGTSSTQVQGTAANGSATVGNPVLVAGSNGTNAETLAVSALGTIVTTSAAAAGDAVSNASAAFVLSSPTTTSVLTNFPFLFNGSTWDRGFYCNKVAIQQTVTNTTQQLVAGVAGNLIRICDVFVQRTDVTAVATTVKLVEGTGANCATGQTNLTGIILASGATAPTLAEPAVVINASATGPIITHTAADAVCVNTTGAASNFDVTIVYEQH